MKGGSIVHNYIYVARELFLLDEDGYIERRRFMRPRVLKFFSTIFLNAGFTAFCGEGKDGTIDKGCEGS